MLVGKRKSHSTGLLGRAGQRLELWQWDGLALVACGDGVYINEGHVSGASALMGRSLSEGDERYLLTDYLGTTLAAFDAEGDRNEPTEVTAWNGTRTSFGAGSDSPEAMSRFTGKPYDADLGAHVFPYRNYRSDMSRWMSADPVGFPDGPNQHFYAPVPTMGVDPWGLSIKLVSASLNYTASGWSNGDYWRNFGPASMIESMVGQTRSAWGVSVTGAGGAFANEDPSTIIWGNSVYVDFSITWDNHAESLQYTSLGGVSSSADGDLAIALRVEYDVRSGGEEIVVTIGINLADSGTGITGASLGVAGKGGAGIEGSLSWTNQENNWFTFGTLTFQEN